MHKFSILAFHFERLSVCDILCCDIFSKKYYKPWVEVEVRHRLNVATKQHDPLGAEYTNITVYGSSLGLNTHGAAMLHAQRQLPPTLVELRPWREAHWPDRRCGESLACPTRWSGPRLRHRRATTGVLVRLLESVECVRVKHPLPGEFGRNVVSLCAIGIEMPQTVQNEKRGCNDSNS